MNRTIRFLAGGSLIAATAVVASGCVDNTETLFAYGVMLLQAPTCAYKADPTQPVLLAGTLDVFLRHGYQAGILVGNQYTPRGAKQQNRAESTRITLRGAEITLTDSTNKQITCASDPNCGNFTVYGTGFVDSNRSEDPGWGLFSAELIPQTVWKYIQQTMDSKNLSSMTVYAAVKVFGESLGGQSIDSSVLTYPIEVCEGCLIEFPLAAIQTDAVAGPTCVSSASSTPTTTPCQLGQDDLVDCRLCATGLANDNPCNHPFSFLR